MRLDSIILMNMQRSPCRTQMPCPAPPLHVTADRYLRLTQTRPTHAHSQRAARCSQLSSTLLTLCSPRHSLPLSLTTLISHVMRARTCAAAQLS